MPHLPPIRLRQTVVLVFLPSITVDEGDHHPDAGGPTDFGIVLERGSTPFNWRADGTSPVPLALDNNHSNWAPYNDNTFPNLFRTDVWTLGIGTNLTGNRSLAGALTTETQISTAGYSLPS